MKEQGQNKKPYVDKEALSLSKRTKHNAVKSNKIIKKDADSNTRV